MSRTEVRPEHVPNFLGINSNQDYEEARGSEPGPRNLVLEPEQGLEPFSGPRTSSIGHQDRKCNPTTAQTAAVKATERGKRAQQKFDKRSQQPQPHPKPSPARDRRRSRSVGQCNNNLLPAVSSGAVDEQGGQSTEEIVSEVAIHVQTLQEALEAAKNAVQERDNLIGAAKDYANEQEELVKTRVKEKMKLRREYNEMQQQYNEVIAERKKLFLEKGILRKEKDEAQISVEKKTREVAEYKRIIASSTGDNQLSDDQLQSKFDALFLRLQGWVFKSFRGQRFKYHSLPKTTRDMMWDFMPRADTLPLDVIDCEWVKITMSIISRVLAELFEPRHYFGMSDEAPLKEIIRLVTNLIQIFTNPDAKTWLESTHKLLVAAAPKQADAAKIKIVDVTVKDIETRLHGALVLKDAAARDLRGIITSAFDLFRVLNHRRSTYSVRLLNVYLGQPAGEQIFTTFDHDSMEEIPQSEQVPHRRPLELSVWPGLYKQVDDGQQRSDIIVAYPKVMVRQEELCASDLNGSQEQSGASNMYKWLGFGN